MKRHGSNDAAGRDGPMTILDIYYLLEHYSILKPIHFTRMSQQVPPLPSLLLPYNQASLFETTNH
jgi:hypothetical protein